MRRITCSALLAAVVCVAAAVPAASAPPKAVGGPGAQAMDFSFTATGPQQHFLAETAGTTPVDPGVGDTCVAPRCYAFPFSAVGATKTAKSVSASAQITWTSPVARFWLSVVDVTKAPVVVGECFSFFTSAGPSATVGAKLFIARKYALWVSVEQVLGASEAVKGVLHVPASDKARVSPLSGADRTGLFLNPCQG